MYTEEQQCRVECVLRSYVSEFVLIRMQGWKNIGMEVRVGQRGLAEGALATRSWMPALDRSGHPDRADSGPGESKVLPDGSSFPTVLLPCRFLKSPRLGSAVQITELLSTAGVGTS